MTQQSANNKFFATTTYEMALSALPATDPARGKIFCSDGTSGLTSGDIYLLNTAGTVVSLDSHGTRHNPDGADPITVAAPVTIGTANSVGVANSVSRSDHVHDHGAQTSPTLHAAATGANNGFMSAADKTKLDASTSANTASALVQRDGSGGFSMGTLTATNATLSNTSNQLALGTTNVATLTITPTATYTLTVPDTAGASSFVMTTLAQNVGGVKTFTSAPVAPAISLTNTSNQLALGTTNVATITLTPTASYTLTIPDTAGASSFVMTTTNQDIFDFKNFHSQVTAAGIFLSIASNQIQLGPAPNTATITLTPTASYTLTIPDTAGASSFVMTTLAQNVGGVKTFTSAPVAPAISLTNTTNQLILGTTNTTTISATAPAASSVYTVPDVGITADFIMSAGAQNVGGTKTFTSAPSAPAISLTNTSNQIALGTTNVATITTSPTATYTLTIPDTAGASSFVMTTNTQSIGGAKTFTVAPSAPTINLTNSTNQIVFNTTNTQTISVTATAASRVYTLPNSGTNCEFVMGAGAQTIAGAKTFSDSILLATSGGTASNFNYYEESSYTSTFTVGGTVSASVTITLTRTGRVVTLQQSSGIAAITPGASGTMSSNTAAAARFRPTTGDITFPILGRSNSVDQLIIITIQTTGTLLLRTSAIGSFPNTGTCAFYPFAITYSV